jgi:HAAS
VIDAYIAELRDALRGPRRATADLVAEARDSLADAAEAYQRKGFDRDDAERRAVREFGDVRAIAPDYQRELGLAQARRTALVVLVAVAAQWITAEIAWRWAAPAVAWRPDAHYAHYALLAHAVDLAGYVTLAGALVAVLASGIGMRRLISARQVVRATGVFAFSVYGFFAVAALLLTSLSPVGHSIVLSPVGVFFVAMCWVAPSSIAFSAYRCLNAA